MDQVMRYPVWYRVIAVAGARVVEESCFPRGSVTRLAMFIGRLWLAAAVALIGFYALHVPICCVCWMLCGAVTVDDRVRALIGAVRCWFPGAGNAERIAPEGALIGRGYRDYG